MPFVWAFTTVFAWLRGLLPWIAGALGATVSGWLVSAGFGIVVFTGFNMATSRLIAIAVNAFNDLNGLGQLGADIIALAGLMWLDTALNLLISTGAFLLAVKGVRQGTYAAHVWTKPGQGGMPG